MKDKNKGKVFKPMPLTFEEKMEKMMQEQREQIESLSKMVEVQFEMIKTLQEGKNFQCGKCGFLDNKIINESKGNIVENEVEDKRKSKNFMIENILKIKSEKNKVERPPLVRMKTEKLVKDKIKDKMKTNPNRKKFSINEPIFNKINLESSSKIISPNNNTLNSMPSALESSNASKVHQDKMENSNIEQIENKSHKSSNHSFKPTDWSNRKPINMKIKVISEEEKIDLISSPIENYPTKMPDPENLVISKVESKSFEDNNDSQDNDEEHSAILRDILVEEIK